LRLVKGLGVDMVDIVSDTNDKVDAAKTRRSVTYSGEGSEHSIGTHDYKVLCTDLSEKKMIPMLATIKAKSINELKSDSSKKNSFLASHEGEEVLYVVSGQVILHTECYTPLTLNPGDCAYIDSTMGHVCLKGSDEDAVVFWVCSDNNSLTVFEPNVNTV
jgi:mannose-6-phosphate isomerase class I